ncbi:MAG: 23S rRNA (guanosine(2251)-2'-O)-methyltransferase RlmB [Clostridia bacterium]|nr:23S rRNA (guanosine(2251)-2'-O)-methyltransferase RlmB [Clostridia bacterium]
MNDTTLSRRDRYADGPRGYDKTARQGTGFNGRREDKPAYGKDKPAYGKDKPAYRDKPAPRKEKPATEPEQEKAPDELPFLVFGRNAVKEAIKAGRSIDKILVQTEPDGSLREILALAREARIIVHEVNRKKLDEICLPFGHGGKTANHQGIAAYTAGVEYCEVSDILALAKERNEAPFVVVLDGVEDPHNLGAIIRSADCAGAHGVILGKHRSAPVTAAAVKASAGAAEYVPIARVTNITAALEELKQAGLWVAGADMAGESAYKKDLTGAFALVIGNEGEGLSRLVKQKCDFLVSIPMGGHVDSLNAGVAAGILLFEKRRQEGKGD